MGEYAKKLAREHVEWFMGVFNMILPPLLETFMEHGYKHGQEDQKEDRSGG
jgi:hypothetical protein